MIDIRSKDELIAATSGGLAPDFLFFWGHTAAADAGITKACLSQWWEAPFQAEGCLYPTAEHYMMAGKARLFNDQQAIQAVLQAATPAEVKAIGRQIRGFDDTLWKKHRFDVVVSGNLAKFSQHHALRDYLLATADQILVEASPHDTVWGIGLAATDSRARNPAEWPGLNLLGFALMEVRERLRAG